MTRVMSTSLKVVSWAAVFCDSFRRSAMVLRRRVIATFSSRSAWLRGPAGAAAGAAGLAARASSAPSMSPLVTRPSRPVPATDGGGDAGFFGDAAGGRHRGRVRLRARQRGAGLGASALGASALAARRQAPRLCRPCLRRWRPGSRPPERWRRPGRKWIQSSRRRARALPPSPCRFPVPASARRGRRFRLPS